MSLRTLLLILALLISATVGAWAQSPSVSSIAGIAQSPVQTVAPGSLISIFGTNLAAGLATADSVPLSTSLGGVSITINNTPAPIQLVSGNQINAQVPWGIVATDPSSPAQLVVTTGAGASSPAPLGITASAPAIFEISGQALAANPDGTLAAPTGIIPGLSTRPAKIGDTLAIFANGLGAVDSAIADGANSMDLTRNTVATPTVLIGGVAATVTFSGLAPSMVGINQINVTIPSGTPTGNAVLLQIQINGQTSNSTTIAVNQ